MSLARGDWSYICLWGRRCDLLDLLQPKLKDWSQNMPLTKRVPLQNCSRTATEVGLKAWIQSGTAIERRGKKAVNTERNFHPAELGAQDRKKSWQATTVDVKQALLLALVSDTHHIYAFTILLCFLSYSTVYSHAASVIPQAWKVAESGGEDLAPSHDFISNAAWWS